MLRPTAFSTLLNLIKTGTVGAIALAAVLSCEYSPTSTVQTPTDQNAVVRVHVNSVIIDVPDSVKERLALEADAVEARAVPMGAVSSVAFVPGSGAAAVASCGGGNGGGFAGYSKTRVDFKPEDIPKKSPWPVADEGWIPADNMPLGFNFNFQGNTYDRVNIYFNGFLLFGQIPNTNTFSSAGSIASTVLPNNIIALSWSDWDLGKNPDGLRYETRGTAPKRRFVLQFDNVPERAGAGLLTSQVVLEEGSNNITIYTTTMTTKNLPLHRVTQGIENATGTSASYDSVLNVNTGITSARVRNFFSLDRDAVRFSPIVISSKDEVPPTIPATVGLTAYNDPGLATAVVAVVAPAATDDCSAVTVTSARSDGVPSLDAPFPVGVTTITWTAKDAEGNTSTATQTVTVIDNEKPVWQNAPTEIFRNATSPNGAVVSFDDLVVTDNVGVTERSCDPASGSVFPMGPPTTVTCTAYDAARNDRSISFTVSIIGAHEQIGALMGQLENLELPNGTAQPVYNQLKSAYDQTADGSTACKKVSDFLSMVQKKSSNILPDDVATLTVEATRILNVMACAPPVRASMSPSLTLQRAPTP